MDLKKYKKEIGFGLVTVAVICLMSVVLLKDDHKETGEADDQQPVYIEVPEGDVTDITPSKYEAYLKTGNNSKIEDYWDQCLEDEEAPAQEEITSPKAVSGAPAASAEELLGLNEPKSYSPAPRATSTNPYRETAEEREARHQRRHEEAIELAERMQEGQQDTPPHEEVIVSPGVHESADLPPAKVKRSDIISSLDGWEGDGGMSSLDEDSAVMPEDPYTPFRCMFARESKITDGQRVTVILLDDINVSGTSVPRNTHLMATCQLTNRLELEFVNIEIGGRILPLGFEAYDIDGSKGIYCQDAGSAGKTVKSRGADIVSSTLSSRLGRVARDVASTGISLVQSADGQRTVSVPAGYTFFIIKKKQN